LARDRVGEAAVAAACTQHLKLERFRVFKQHRAQSAQARQLIDAARHEATAVLKTVAVMDVASMVAFLGDSKYCVAAECQRVARQKQEDARNTSARAASDLLRVPMDALRVYSGPPRTRFEAMVLSEAAHALAPRMGLGPWAH
jgi:hypothetical protein